MILLKLLFILPMVVAVTFGQANNGIGYYGSSNVRDQRPIYGRRPLPLLATPLPLTGSVIKAVPNIVTSAAPVVTEPATKGVSPTASVLQPSPGRRQLFYRPLVPPHPIRQPLQPVVQSPVTVAPAPTEVITPESEPAVLVPNYAPISVEEVPPAPISPPALEEPAQIPQSTPIEKPILQPDLIAHPEPVAQPKPALQPEVVPQPKPVPQPEPISQPELTASVVVPQPESIAPVIVPQPEPIAPVVISQPDPISQPEPIQSAILLQPAPIAPVIHPQTEPIQPAVVPQPEPITPIIPPQPEVVWQPEPVWQREPVAQSESILQPEPVPQPEAIPEIRPERETPKRLSIAQIALFKHVALPPLLPRPQPVREPTFGRHLQTSTLPIIYDPTVSYPAPTVATQVPPVLITKPALQLEVVPQPKPFPQPEPISQPELTAPVVVPLPEPIHPVVISQPEPIAPVDVPQPEPIAPVVVSQPEPIQSAVVVQPAPIAPAIPPQTEPIQPAVVPQPEPISPVVPPQPEVVWQPEPVAQSESVLQPEPVPQPEAIPEIRPERETPKRVSLSNPYIPIAQIALSKQVALPPLRPRPQPVREPSFGRHLQTSTPPAIYYSTVSYPTPMVATQVPPVLVTRQPASAAVVTAPIGTWKSEFQCKETHGYYSIEHECDTYIECKENKAIILSCPDGLHFNPAAKHYEYPCAYPSEVKCTAGDVEQNPKPTATCPNQYGFYSLNDGDCSKFLMCQEGLATIENCPIGLVFNPETSSCDWPANVPQCNPDVFKNFTCPAPPQDDGQVSDIIYKYRYGQQCKLYLACQRGHPRLLSCDPGLSFDEKSQSCIDEDYFTDCVVM